MCCMIFIAISGRWIQKEPTTTKRSWYRNCARHGSSHRGTIMTSGLSRGLHQWHGPNEKLHCWCRMLQWLERDARAQLSEFMMRLAQKGILAKIWLPIKTAPWRAASIFDAWIVGFTRYLQGLEKWRGGKSKSIYRRERDPEQAIRRVCRFLQISKFRCEILPDRWKLPQQVRLGLRKQSSGTRENL